MECSSNLGVRMHLGLERHVEVLPRIHSAVPLGCPHRQSSFLTPELLGLCSVLVNFRLPHADCVEYFRSPLNRNEDDERLTSVGNSVWIPSHT